MFKSAHLELACSSCKKKHPGRWEHEFWKHDHYKTLNCGCGYKVHIKTQHFHSGHD